MNTASSCSVTAPQQACPMNDVSLCLCMELHQRQARRMGSSSGAREHRVLDTTELPCRASEARQRSQAGGLKGLCVSCFVSVSAVHSSSQAPVELGASEREAQS